MLNCFAWGGRENYLEFDHSVYRNRITLSTKFRHWVGHGIVMPILLKRYFVPILMAQIMTNCESHRILIGLYALSVYSIKCIYTKPRIQCTILHLSQFQGQSIFDVCHTHYNYRDSKNERKPKCSIIIERMCKSLETLSHTVFGCMLSELRKISHIGKKEKKNSAKSRKIA